MLVRQGGFVDGTFGYESNHLPEVNDVIELSRAGADSVLAKVTGIEKAKSRPIRATELGGLGQDLTFLLSRDNTTALAMAGQPVP